MGKPKTQRTDELRSAARRYIIVEEAQNHIEQHNFDRLVAQGVLVESVVCTTLVADKPGDWTQRLKQHSQGVLVEGGGLEHLRLRRHYETIDNIIINAAVEGGL